MFDQINKYKASFGRLFEAKTLKVMLEIALLTILLSFLGPIKNMIYTEVVNKLSLGITVKLGIIMFASYIVVQVIEECVSYFQIYLNTVLQLKLGQSVSHEINNKLAKVKLNSLEMYEIHDLVSRANQTIKSSIVSSLNLIIALYTPLATIVLQLASLVWVAWYVPILIAVFNVPYIFILVKSNHRRYELERKITKEKRVEKYFVELLSDRYAAKDIRTYDLVNFFFSKMIDVKEMPCGNAIPAEDAGHQTEKDVAGRESDRVPAPEMNPKVQLELLSGEGRKKAIGAVVIYNAVTIRGISVVENSKKNPFVKMPRAPKGARTKHSDIAYPINRAAREMLYSAVLQEYDRLRSEEELRRQETKLQVS